MSDPHVLPARAGLAGAEAFLALVRDGAPVPALDARAVEEISAAWVLALVALARARGEGAERVAVIAPSPAFVDAFSDLGFFQDLMRMEFRP